MSLTAPLIPAAQAAGATQIIIAYAGGPATAAAWDDLQLPNLQALLARMSPDTAISGDEFDFSPPHERMLARSLQLPEAPGQIAWAALAAGQTEQACAFITPCHWHIGADQVVQSDPAAAPLGEEESRQLLTLISPWFADDGITIDYLQPDLWLARGAAFEQLATASLDRVQNRDVRPWVPDAKQGAIIQRLQSELQMLLYTHVFNDQRAQRGLPPINSFWVHGAGRLDQLPQAGTAAACVNDLRASALQGDIPAWRQAWQQLDSGLMAELGQRLAQGENISLTLCGERNAVTWQAAKPGLLDKIKSIFGTKPLPDLREML